MLFNKIKDNFNRIKTRNKKLHKCKWKYKKRIAIHNRMTNKCKVFNRRIMDNRMTGRSNQLINRLSINPSRQSNTGKCKMSRYKMQKICNRVYNRIYSRIFLRNNKKFVNK